VRKKERLVLQGLHWKESRTSEIFPEKLNLGREARKPVPTLKLSVRFRNSEKKNKNCLIPFWSEKQFFERT